MKTSCVAHPPEGRYISIREWQIAACDGNACAAALLSFFEWYHNSHIASLSESPNASLWQNHTEESLEKGIFIYKRKSISEAIKLLEDKGFIVIGRNPDKRYSFDRTKHFLFVPEAVNLWLAENASPSRKKGGSTEQKGIVSDDAKKDEQYTKKTSNISPQDAGDDFFSLTPDEPYEKVDKHGIPTKKRNWVKSDFVRVWETKTGLKCPWDDKDERALTSFLLTWEKIDPNEFGKWADNWAQSKNAIHTTRWFKILPNLNEWAQGPVNQFKRVACS